MLIDSQLRPLPRYRPVIEVPVNSGYVNSGGSAASSWTASLPPQHLLRYGDMLVARGLSSSFSSVSVAGQGWTMLAQAINGDVAFMAYRIYRAPGLEVPPVFSGGSGRWAIIVHALRVKGPLLHRPQMWVRPVGDSVASGSQGITTVTGSTNIDIRPGDMVLQVVVNDDDLAGWSRPSNAIDAAGVEWAAASVQNPSSNFNSGNNASPLGNDTAADCVHRRANWASGASTGVPTLASNSAMVRPHVVWGRFRAALPHRAMEL